LTSAANGQRSSARDPTCFPDRAKSLLNQGALSANICIGTAVTSRDDSAPDPTLLNQPNKPHGSSKLASRPRHHPQPTNPNWRPREDSRSSLWLRRNMRRRRRITSDLRFRKLFGLGCGALSAFWAPTTWRSLEKRVCTSPSGSFIRSNRIAPVLPEALACPKFFGGRLLDSCCRW